MQDVLARLRSDLRTCSQAGMTCVQSADLAALINAYQMLTEGFKPIEAMHQFEAQRMQAIKLAMTEPA